MERSFVCNYDDGTTEEYRLTGKEIAVMHFEGEVVVSDPGYTKDAFCRINVTVEPGEYHCVAWEFDGGAWGTRVGIISLMREDDKNTIFEVEELGVITVDTGLAGFFMGELDYSETEWNSFCDRFFGTDENPKDGNAWAYEYGFFSSTGYGDGMYSVYAYKKDGKIWGLEIVFF